MCEPGALALGKWHVRGLLGLCWTVVCMALLRAVEYSLPAKLALTWLPLLFGWCMARIAGNGGLAGRHPRGVISGPAWRVVLACLGLYWALEMLGELEDTSSSSGWEALQPGIWWRSD